MIASKYNDDDDDDSDNDTTISRGQLSAGLSSESTLGLAHSIG